jgi:plastocyanin domain-containing protein
MSAADYLVIAGGLAAIALVNWYFFLAGRMPATAAALSGGLQEVTITVRGGYDPAAVRVQKGKPVRLVFDRQETSGCSEEVVFGDFGVRRFLPPFEKTTVELTPAEAGSYEFTCGMGMLRGRLVVEEGESHGRH